MTKYLVTGVAGFIGSNLAEAIIDNGDSVVGVDNFLTGKPENIATFKEQIQFFEGSICDSKLMAQACEGVDYVLHHAAMASVPWSMKDPILAHDNNVTGTLTVLESARTAGVKKVVMAVTSAAYGNTEILPSTEDLPPDPLSPYAVTKLMGESYLAMYSSIYGLPTVGLRYFNVFGKRQDPQSAYAAAIPIFAKKVLANQAPVVFGDGLQTRDFVYIEDIVQANLKACVAGPEADGQVFNIGTGKRVTVNEICEKIIDLLDSSVTLSHVEKRQGDVLHSVADISKAQKMLGYKPAFDVMTGLEQAIGWYKENLK